MKIPETRAVSSTGGMKGTKLPRLGGTDPQAMMELAKVYGMGEMKYERYNYLKGYPWSQSIDALLRHLFAFLDGEDYDECTVHPGMHGNAHEYDPDACDGSGLLHTSHVSWHGLTLTSFVQRGIGTDDRAPRRPVPPEPIDYDPDTEWCNVAGCLLLAHEGELHEDEEGAFLVPMRVDEGPYEYDWGDV